jgi:hypothetical protein
MKTKVEIEIGNYEIKIEEIDGVISVKAEKDDEVIEEFSIQVEEGDSEEDSEQDIQGDKIKGFGEFGDEEEDFEDEESEEGDSEEGEFEGEEMEEDDIEEGDTPALESFQSFINRRK